LSKKQIQSQFGPVAAAYATSEVHARGASLARLVELVKPQSDWKVLDVATAAGHTAFVFAPKVAQVTATDITPEMLDVAAKLASERGITNVTFQPADAEELPFEAGQFDLVTCRIAPHHFPRVDHFMREAARVLKPKGLLAIVDNVVPGSQLHGKKAERLREAGAYINAFEKLRDPSHVRCLSLGEWFDVFRQAGITLAHQETAQKEMDFDPWADRMRVSAADRVRLKVLLRQAPAAATQFLTPRFAGDRITFYLTEAILIGRMDRTD